MRLDHALPVVADLHAEAVEVVFQVAAPDAPVETSEEVASRGLALAKLVAQVTQLLGELLVDKIGMVMVYLPIT